MRLYFCLLLVLSFVVSCQSEDTPQPPPVNISSVMPAKAFAGARVFLNLERIPQDKGITISLDGEDIEPAARSIDRIDFFIPMGASVGTKDIVLNLDGKNFTRQIKVIDVSDYDLHSIEKIGTIPAAGTNEALRTASNFFEQYRPLARIHAVFDVDVYKIVYDTELSTKTTRTSALLCLPATIEEMPVLSIQNVTITRHSDAPTKALKLIDISNPLGAFMNRDVNIVPLLLCAFATEGYITVIPDYIGFGESEDEVHPYYVRVPTAKSVRQAIAHATQFLLGYGRAHNRRLYLMGYSQGGFASLAAQRLIESKPIPSLTLMKVNAGSGAYDISHMRTYVRGRNTYEQLGFFPYAVLAYKAYVPGLADLDLAAIFQSHTEAEIRALYDGSKSLLEIGDALGNKVRTLFTDAVLTDETTFATAALTAALHEAFEANSLNQGWVPSTPMHLYHGDADELVPKENTNKVVQDLRVLSSADLIGETIYKDTNPELTTHFNTGIIFYADALKDFRER